MIYSPVPSHSVAMFVVIRRNDRLEAMILHPALSAAWAVKARKWLSRSSILDLFFPPSFFFAFVSRVPEWK